MFLYLKSNDSISRFPNNSNSDFIVQLAENMSFNRKLSVAIAEFQCPPIMSDDVEDLYIYCDICHESYVGELKRPVLRRVFHNSDNKSKQIIFTRPLYIPLRQFEFHQIRIYIKTSTDKDVIFKEGVVKCTLHIT